MRLLIIEDESNLREQLKQYLEKQGYAVDVAEDGEAGFLRQVSAVLRHRLRGSWSSF